MMTKDLKALCQGRPAALAALGLLVALGACSTDKVTVPGLNGPSELALSLSLTARPDILIADGASTAAVQATLFDQNGHPVVGRAIFFAVTDLFGTAADIGELSATTAVTGSTGVAVVIYRSPARTDFTANQKMMVTARPVGTDAGAALYRTVQIELRSAEGRLFPPRSGNASPTCGIVVQAPFGFKTNQSILFQTRSADSDGEIVRYFWSFGDPLDPATSDKPDVNHVYRAAGSYTVTHIVTDNNGAQATCNPTEPIDITD